uniref:Uncharacterized protein n=1 Tax=Arundo donax TaxID=35708 RepID=A0A0A8Y6Q6_ARUDO
MLRPPPPPLETLTLLALDPDMK